MTVSPPHATHLLHSLPDLAVERSLLPQVSVFPITCNGIGATRRNGPQSFLRTTAVRTCAVAGCSTPWRTLQQKTRLSASHRIQPGSFGMARVELCDGGTSREMKGGEGS